MKKKVTEPNNVYTARLVKSEDLNHHKTLFAGRIAEWFVEAGFLAAAKLFDPKRILCLNIHGMHFTKPVLAGQILDFTSKIVYTGKSSLIAYIQVKKDDDNDPFVRGFITFICVDENTRPVLHHIEIKPKTEEDITLYDKAKCLKK